MCAPKAGGHAVRPYKKLFFDGTLKLTGFGGAALAAAINLIPGSRFSPGAWEKIARRNTVAALWPWGATGLQV